MEELDVSINKLWKTGRFTRIASATQSAAGSMCGDYIPSIDVYTDGETEDIIIADGRMSHEKQPLRYDGKLTADEIMMLSEKLSYNQFRVALGCRF